jgi:hypothetical protein
MPVQIAVQRLLAPELVGPDDIVVAVRVLRMRPLKFTENAEIVVSKAETLGALRARLPGLLVVPPLDPSNGAAGEADWLQLSKALSNGPPLKPADAAKLKWDDAKWCADDCPVAQPPVNLRDGSLLLVRSRADAAAAAAVAAAAAPTQGSAGTTTKGRVWQSSTSEGSSKLARREQGLNIAVTRQGAGPSLTRAGPVAGAAAEASAAPHSPRHALAAALGVPLNTAAFALEASNGDAALAAEIIRCEVG